MGQDDLGLATKHLAVLNPETAFRKVLVEFAEKAINVDIGTFRKIISKYVNKKRMY